MRKRAASTISAPPVPSIQGLDAHIEVRRHARARRLTLRVSRTRRAVIVTMPVQCDPGEAGPLIHRNLAWVRERLGCLPEAVPFRDGARIPLRGEIHEVAFSGGRARKGGGPVQVTSAIPCPELRIPGRPERAPRRLRDWLFAEARRDLAASVEAHAARLGLSPKRIAIRDQTSRWGSCSTTRVLSFSWRLVLAPPFVLDYVAAHEVAHLAEMNHGRRFWTLVRGLVPRMDEAKRWLQVYGLDLYRYSPPEHAA